ncbi:hypothetical protein C8Q80DRAFT_1324466 [Daedaleopsis nitida]|nr:hypothetical protein C8Q80DRAFT_1324466 [Daedaleopsis nitida]
MSADALSPSPVSGLNGDSSPEARQTEPTSNSEPLAGVVRNRTKISSMRAHRGNIPTLPQTKLCHLCPAKFTRTTHLNRHLKTHSNERTHECDRCHAQFTRSDLLTRHKRTCCETSANKTRRKSCKSCAESKVKCDLQRPCSKCKARGRECVYASTSSVARGSGAARNSPNEASSPEATTTPSGSSSHDSPPAAGPSSQTSTSSAAQPTGATLSFPSDILDDLSALTSLTPCTSSLEDPSASTTSTLLNGTLASTSLIPQIGQDGEEDVYRELFSSEMYDGLFSNVFTSSFEKNPLVPGQHFHQDPTSILIDRFETTGISQATMDMFFGMPAQLALYSVPSDPTPVDPHSSIPETEMAGLQQALAPYTEMPTISEMYQYTVTYIASSVASFLTTFTYHMPIIHLPTFLSGARIHLLVKATKAAGAMYHSTQTAANYINLVLAKLRDEIITELVRISHTTDYDTILQLTLATCLVQTVGMFHKDPEQRTKSNVYHGMIVMMLRMNGFVDKVREWKYKEIDFTDPSAVQTAWKDWVRHECAKRALWVCYLHDCSHSVFFNLSPTFTTEQFSLGLPCEDALWSAKNPIEWAEVLQTPSLYGNTELRLTGHLIKSLYFYMIHDNPTGETREFYASPFAHLIIIHTMMRKLFEFYLRDRLPLQQRTGASAQPKLNPHFVDKERVYHIQILLHCWLQSWLSSPDSPRDVPESQQRYLFNAIPYYWLTQVGLVAYQEGLAPFDPEGVYISSHEAKFHLLKKWEKHIRQFLERGEEAPTMFWDEVMKSRTETWQAESGFEFTHLMGFFLPNTTAA